MSAEEPALFRLVVGDTVPQEKRAEVQAWLDTVTDEIHRRYRDHILEHLTHFQTYGVTKPLKPAGDQS